MYVHKGIFFLFCVLFFFFTTPCHSLLLNITTHLHSIVSLYEHFLAADAAVHTTQCHVQAETEEVAMVEVAYTVV